MDSRIEEIKARVEAATPAPWNCGYSGRGIYPAIFAGTYGQIASKIRTMGGYNLPQKSTGDAEFIAHAREDIPFLLSELDKREKEIEHLKTAVDCERKRFVDKSHEAVKLQAAYDKAVEDMKVMALAMRESEEMPEGCCFACIYDAKNLPDNCILPYGECPGYEKTDCFVYYGKDGQ